MKLMQKYSATRNLSLLIVRVHHYALKGCSCQSVIEAVWTRE